MHHPSRQPLYPDGQSVLDPLVILSLNEMRCSQSSFLAIDLFSAAGYRARAVQLGGHVVVEVFYDNDWHYFDADVFSNGQIFQEPNGNIPSVHKLSLNPYWIDKVPSNFEHHVQMGYADTLTGRYPSQFYFHKKDYGGLKPVYYVKSATQDDELNAFYGWNFYQTVADPDRQLNEGPRYYFPRGVTFANILLNQRTLNLTWNPAHDDDGDLIGYRVFISQKKRGWNFRFFRGPPQIISTFWSKYPPWHPDMYDLLGKLPPHDVALIETKTNYLEFRFSTPGEYYLTVMPFDKHGEDVGRTLYPLSGELYFKID